MKRTIVAVTVVVAVGGAWYCSSSGGGKKRRPEKKKDRGGMQQDKYVAMNAKYLQEGEELLERGDYPQASEKLWGAVAQAVKVVAEFRGWRHSSHRDLRGAIDRLFRETADEEVPRLFSVAESLHANF